MTNEEKMYNPNELEIGILVYLKKRKIIRWPDIVYTNYKPLRGMLFRQVNGICNDVIYDSKAYPLIPEENVNERMLVVMNNVSIEPLLTYLNITSLISDIDLAKFSNDILFNTSWWEANCSLFGIAGIAGIYFAKSSSLLPRNLGEIMKNSTEIGTVPSNRELKLLHKY